MQYDQISDPPNNSCPIRQEEFDSGDEVMQVIPCGHVFYPRELRRWFLSSVRCPLCRADIRDYDPRSAVHNPHATASQAASTGLDLSDLNSTSATAALDAATGEPVGTPAAQDNTTRLSWSDEIASILTGGVFGADGTGIPPGTSVTVEYELGGGTSMGEASTQTASDEHVGDEQ